MVVGDDLLAEFLSEATSHLDAADRELARIATEGRDAILGILRRIHTIRGTAGFLAVPDLEQLRVVEIVLDDLRHHDVLPDDVERRVRGALAIARTILAAADRTGSVPPPQQDASAARRPDDAGQAGPVLRIRGDALDRLSRTVEALASPAGDDAELRPILVERLRHEMAALRRQPLCLAWSKLGLVVDEIAAGAGKSIAFRTSGGDVELDHRAIALLRDALTHLVRNAAHHGIETTADRLAHGKAAFGTIRVSATTSADEVVVAVTDDGAGLDIEAIRGRAVALRLTTRDAIGGLGRDALARLVFAPGFSTSDRVGSLSGLGIGLDVVRTNIAELGGTVSLDVPPGGGLTVLIRLPREAASAADVTNPADSASPDGAILLVAPPGARRDAVGALLSALGGPIHTADDADEALALALARPFRAIVADQDLPRRPGLDLARAVRRHPPFAGLDVVLMLAPGATLPQTDAHATGIVVVSHPLGARMVRGLAEDRTAA